VNVETAQKRILIVEDEALIAIDLEQRLTGLGYAVPGIADSAASAIQEIEDKHPDLLLVDIRIRGPVDGIALAEQVKHRYKLPVIFLTAHADPSTLQRAKATEPFGYLVKPVGTASLPTAIEVALYKHKIEQELRRQRSWLETTLRSIGDGVVVTGAAGNVVYVNDSALHLLQTDRDACLGQPLEDVFRLRFNASELPLDDLTEVAAAEDLPLPLPAEIHALTATGAKIPVEGTIAASLMEGERFGSVIVFRDIAVRQAAEREMREEQKTIAVGRLAAGVSHDLEGMLAAIEECTGAAEHHCRDALFAGLREVAGTAASLNGRLRALIRRKGLPLEPLSVASFVERQLPALRSAMPANIALAARSGYRGATVRACPDQLGGIVKALVTNAAEAMPDGGAIAIETGRVDNPQGQSFVRIAVRDNGPGMAPEVVENIFEPFFTTKPGNHCAGLGLAAAQSAVSTLGGFMSVNSKPGAGTTIEVFLPDAIADTPAAGARWPTVLLVESNGSVRRVLHNYLEKHDYNLLEAADSSEALDMAEVYDGPIDLLVIDISGVALAAQLKAARPEMKVLFATEEGNAGGELRGASVLSKPITKGRLLQRVAAALG
jgi:two-component system, cell cycle sensor histidine kinase and response regulator CckA